MKFIGQKISFHHRETTEIKNRIRAAWATFRKYRQELTSKNNMLKHRLRLFDAAISPTICYAARTWTPNKEHEKMIQSTQRKMLRLIIQTKRKHKKIEKQDIGPTMKLKKLTSMKDDVDSDVSFEDDADEEIDTTSIEEEDWVEYIKRSTEEAIENMENAKIRCWTKTHDRMKWKLALRITTSPSDRWLRKAANWNPELSTRYKN